MDTTTWDTPLANPRRESYCQERAAGRTQRQAMLAAWPDCAHWKPEAVDNKGCKLEAEDEVKPSCSVPRRCLRPEGDE